MKTPEVSAELLLQMRHDRGAIAGELAELELQDARLQRAAAEDTLCGHLRLAIHASHRSLKSLASDAGIEAAELHGFLEGERSLPSDVLDRLAVAAGVVVTLATPRG
ncbi:MAG: hypothetical protein ACKOZU_07095 [Planctomycetaceae bacterium]